MNLKILFVSSLVAFNALLWHSARADSPLPAPSDRRITSRNGKFVAWLDWKAQKTTVYNVQKAKKTQLWQMSGWHQNAYLADNGRNFIAFYPGANLLNLDYKPTDVMMSFYDRGKLVRQVRLDEIVANPTPDKFRKTVSHYAWLETYGLVGDKFVIDTLQHKTLAFDIRTGKRLKK